MYCLHAAIPENYGSSVARTHTNITTQLLQSIGTVNVELTFWSLEANLT